MIRFDNLPPDVMQSMCQPMHLILPPAQSAPSSSAHHHYAHHPTPSPGSHHHHHPHPHPHHHPAASPAQGVSSSTSSTGMATRSPGGMKKLRPNAPSLAMTSSSSMPGTATAPTTPGPGMTTNRQMSNGTSPGGANSRSPGGITTNAPGALYLGSLSAITDLDNLRAHRIGLLVQVLDVPWLPEEPSKVLHIQTHRLPILDIPSADLKPHLETTCAIIERALAEGRNVLVHCQQGVSRSSAIVIAYLICKHGMTYEQAFEFCKARRACVKPNSGFVACLKEWEKQWRPRPPANIRRQTTH